MSKIVTLSGSTRFRDNLLEVYNELTMEGYIVLADFTDHSKQNEGNWKELVDKLHLEKIDLADELFVVNVNGYIGDSTKREIEYAKSKGKLIRYLE